MLKIQNLTPQVRKELLGAITIGEIVRDVIAHLVTDK
jgi:hypothetical protein